MNTCVPGNACSGYFRSHELNLHYLSWGNESLPVIIMLHGIRSYANTWAPVAELLSDRFRVIALDQRGRGASDWSARHAYFGDDYVADMEALVEHLKLENFSLLGHSMGGANALLYADRHADKVCALVIEDAGPGSSTGSAGAKRIIREFTNTPIEFDNWEAGREFWRSIRPNISEQSLSSRVNETLKRDADGKVRWRFDFVGIRDARLAAARDPDKLPDLWPCIDRLQCPTLVMRGSRSDYLTPEVMREMAERNGRIETVEIPDATHYVHDDNLPAYMDVLRGFLNRT